MPRPLNRPIGGTMKPKMGKKPVKPAKAKSNFGSTVKAMAKGPGGIGEAVSNLRKKRPAKKTPGNMGVATKISGPGLVAKPRGRAGTMGQRRRRVR